MRTWSGLLTWLVLVGCGLLLVALGSVRWLIALGGVLVGVGLVLLVWSVLLYALCQSLRAVLLDLLHLGAGGQQVPAHLRQTQVPGVFGSWRGPFH